MWQPENSIKSHMVSYCSVIKYSNSLTSCRDLPEDLPFPFSECRVFQLCNHGVLNLSESPAQSNSLVIHRCLFSSYLSHLFKVSGWMDQEDRAESKLCLAILLNLLLSMTDHLELLGVLTNRSLNSPAVSEFLDR